MLGIAAGAPVAFTASQLDRGLSWATLGPVLDGPRPAVPAPDIARQRFELPGTYRARRLVLGEHNHWVRRGNAMNRERGGHRQFWAERPVINPAKTAAELYRTEEAATARQREHTPATTAKQATLWQNGSPAARLAGLSYPVDPRTGRRPVQNPALRRVLEEEVAEATRQPITPGSPHASARPGPEHQGSVPANQTTATDADHRARPPDRLRVLRAASQGCARWPVGNCSRMR